MSVVCKIFGHETFPYKVYTRFIFDTISVQITLTCTRCDYQTVTTHPIKTTEHDREALLFRFNANPRPCDGGAV